MGSGFDFNWRSLNIVGDYRGELIGTFRWFWIMNLPWHVDNLLPVVTVVF